MKNCIQAIVITSALAWGCTTPSTHSAETDYIAVGDSLSKITFEKLSGILKAKISAEGFPAAVSYCHTKAKSLTDSYGDPATKIRRTSLKPRNAANTADELEQEVLALFQQKWTNGDSLTPILKTDAAGNTHYFKPIMLQPLCTGCHGDTEKEVASETLASILQKYPSDMATGYKTGDLRGAWHITFLKKQSE